MHTAQTRATTTNRGTTPTHPQRSLDEIKRSLRDRLAERTENCFDIAEDISDAKDRIDVRYQGKQRAQAFKKFCGELGMSYSNALKYEKIGKSDNLRRCRDRLGTLAAMSSLHALAIMEQKEFDAFEEQFLSDGPANQPLTREDIDTFRATFAGRTTAPRSQRKLVTIEIAEDAALSSTDEKDLIELVEKLESHYAAKLNVIRHPGFDELVQAREVAANG